MSESSGGEDNNDVTLDRLHLSSSSSPPPPPPPPPLCALRAHGGDVQAAVLSLCGSLLYSGDSEGHLRIWDVEDRRTVFSLQLHPSEGGVLGLFLVAPPRSSSSSSSSARGTRELLSQGREGTLKLWRLSDSGREIVDGGGDAAAGGPSSSSSEEDPRSPPPPPPPRPIKTTATGSRGFCVLSAVVEAEEEEEGGGRGGRLLAAVASEDAASVRVFDARRAELLCELSEAEAAAAAPASSSSGAAEGQGQGKSRGMAMAVSLFSVGTSLHALVGYEDGSVVLWRCLEGGARRKGKKKSDGGDDDGDGDGGAGAAASASAPPRALSSLRIHFDAVTAIVAAASQDPRGKKKSPLRFFSGGADSVLASYLIEVSAPSSSPSSLSSPPCSLSLSPGPAAKLPARGVGALAVLQRSEDDGTALVVAGGWDGAIRLLGLREEEEKGQGEEDDETSPPCSSSPPPPPSVSLEPLGELEHHVAPIAALTFDSSGELLASGGRDGSVALWGGLGGLV